MGADGELPPCVGEAYRDALVEMIRRTTSEDRVMSRQKTGCPVCGASLFDHGGADIVGEVAAADDTEGKERLDVIVTCSNCESALNVFVAVRDLVVVAEGVAP